MTSEIGDWFEGDVEETTRDGIDDAEVSSVLEMGGGEGSGAAVATATEAKSGELGTGEGALLDIVVLVRGSYTNTGPGTDAGMT